MLRLMIRSRYHRNEGSLYNRLVMACKSITQKQINVDVGSGGTYTRFSTSDNTTLTETQVKEYCDFLNFEFAVIRRDFNLLKHRFSNDFCFNKFRELQQKLQAIPGIGPLRSSHLIQIAALFRLIPLQLYVFLPPSTSSSKNGSLKFWKHDMQWDDKDIYQLYTKELVELQNIYGQSFTSNMFENISCILGRSKARKDIFYKFPIITKDDNNQYQVGNIYKDQFVFRVKVNDINNIALIVKTSSTSKERVVYSSKANASMKDNDIISYRETAHNDDESLSMITIDGHYFASDWFENEFLKPNDITPTVINTTTLPKFEQLYLPEQQLEGTQNWNQFSVIHSTPSNSFSFIVYNASHQLKNGEKVNVRSRLRITFPKTSSYFIIFHGRLVHNGDKSFSNDDDTVHKSTRLFSYLTVQEHNSTCTSFRNSRRLTTYTKNVNYGTVDTSTFQIDLDDKISDEEIVNIELPSRLEEVSSSKQSQLTPILGNMNCDGWEVYCGINFECSQLRSFSKDINELVCNHSKKFNGISNTNRKIYDISSLDAFQSKSIRKLSSLSMAFDILLFEKLRKIPYLEEVSMDKKTVLCNLGVCYEQVPHRDYRSVRKL